MSESKTRFYRVRQGNGATHLINLDNVTRVSHSGEGARARVDVHFVCGEPLSLTGADAGDFLSLLERMARDAQVIYPPSRHTPEPPATPQVPVPSPESR